MTLIVSDNSPLNLLIRLGLADILPKLYAQIIIPTEVAREMRDPMAPQAVRNFIATPPGWLDVRTPKTVLLLPRLDPGETAAISLAIELGATLMIDELDGRAQATAHGLAIIGVVGILETAANAGIIPDLALVHSKIKLMNFYVSHLILNQSLARHLAFKKAQSNP